MAAPLVKFSVTDAEIAKLRDQFTGLTCETPERYEMVRVAIAEVRALRVAVERRRVELKADALAFGRNVDAEAKRITSLLEAIETPLKEQKQLIDAEKERVKQAAIEAKRLEMEAALRAERDAEEARLKAIRDAEETRLADERARLDAERRELDEAKRVANLANAERIAREQAERDAEDVRLRAERDALQAERLAVQQARERAERAEFERQATIKAEADAVEKAERDRLAVAKREAEIAALLPDVEKVRVFAAAIRALAPPKVKAKKVAALVSEVMVSLTAIATDLESKAGSL